MARPVFPKLLAKITNDGGLEDSIHLGAGQKVTIFMNTLMRNTYRNFAELWQYSLCKIKRQSIKLQKTPLA